MVNLGDMSAEVSEESIVKLIQEHARTCTDNHLHLKEHTNGFTGNRT
jgi:hypothetical protein